MDKSQLRKSLREKIAALTLEDKKEQSKKVLERLKKCELPKGSVCVYKALPSEVNTDGIIEYFLEDRQVYLPVVEGDDIMLVRIDADTEYEKGAWNISEPIGERLKPEEVNPALTVTPLLGADESLMRLGKGKGFYDRYFQKVNTYKIGIAFREQLVKEVPCDIWDKRLDMLLLPDRIIKK